MYVDITCEQAAEAFVQAVIESSYDVAIQGTERILVAEPPGRTPSAQCIALHDWYQLLTPDDQRNVQKTVQFSAYAAIFHLLALLDGAIGRFPVKDVISDYALYLQTYRDEESERNNQAEFSVRINLVDEPVELHGIFASIVAEREE